MSTKASHLIASAAAVLFTVASLSAVNYNVHGASTALSSSAVEIIDLAPVNVQPTPAERRMAALLSDVSTAGVVTMPALLPMESAGGAAQYSLLGSQLAMPYYSFGNKFGRISKE